MKVGSLSMPEAYIKYNASENEDSDQAREQNMARRQRKVSNNLFSQYISNESSKITPPLDVNTLKLSSGVRLQIEALPESILNKIELFYCCATCGKIFWEGGHFSRIYTQFSEVLNRTGTMYQEEKKIHLICFPERIFCRMDIKLSS